MIPLDPSQARRIPDHRPDPGTQWKDLADLLKGLSEEEQELVFLRFYDGFTLAEISELQGLPLGTVKSRLHRTLDRLRRHLEKE